MKRYLPSFVLVIIYFLLFSYSTAQAGTCPQSPRGECYGSKACSHTPGYTYDSSYTCNNLGGKPRYCCVDPSKPIGKIPNGGTCYNNDGGYCQSGYCDPATNTCQDRPAPTPTSSVPTPTPFPKGSITCACGGSHVRLYNCDDGSFDYCPSDTVCKASVSWIKGQNPPCITAPPTPTPPNITPPPPRNGDCAADSSGNYTCIADTIDGCTQDGYSWIHFTEYDNTCKSIGMQWCCANAANLKNYTPTPTPAPPIPCNKDSHANCISVDTGLGTISTNLPTAIGNIFGIFLSFSGGILLIIIVFSGYRIMTSQGDPEKIKGAKEMLTSAIVGFLFIVFSITILRVIGVDILHIPGFSF